MVLWQSDGGFAGVRFTHDWRRVRCLDADADIETLAAMEESIRAQLLESGSAGVSPANRMPSVAGETSQLPKLIRVIQDSFSNGIQISPPTACLADDPAQEIETLARLYLEAARRDRPREAAGRQVIFTAMRDAFERVGVWPLMRKRIAVSQYTRSGDPLRLDCGYRPNGVVHLFHAVSLASDVDAAKVLAFSFPQIADGIARVENATAELTAVIEPDLPQDDDAIGFALETLQRNRIPIATAAEMPSVAERARVELKI